MSKGNHGNHCLLFIILL